MPDDAVEIRFLRVTVWPFKPGSQAMKVVREVEPVGEWDVMVAPEHIPSGAFENPSPSDWEGVPIAVVAGFLSKERMEQYARGLVGYDGAPENLKAGDPLENPQREHVFILDLWGADESADFRALVTEENKDDWHVGIRVLDLFAGYGLFEIEASTDGGDTFQSIKKGAYKSDAVGAVG